MRRGEHWRLSQNERDEFGLAAMRAVKTLPQIPDEKLGKWGAWLGVVMITYGIVGPRVEQDAQRQQLPSRTQPRVGDDTFARMNEPMIATDEAEANRLAEQLRAGGADVRVMTPEEYAEFARSTQAAQEGWPTLGGTDETLLDRTIAATHGVDQGTLAEHARAHGRLEGN